jgi:hypothetical protein
MDASLTAKYETRTINTQEEFGDLVECSREEMQAYCESEGWDFSAWKPMTLADYMRPDNFPGYPAAYERAVRRFADTEDIETLLAEA